MAIKSIQMTDTKRYVSKFDDGAEDQKTVWILGPLSSRLEAYLKDRGTQFYTDNVSEGGNVEAMSANFRANEVAMETVRFGLKGWEGFIDDNGPVPYETEPASIGGAKYAGVKQSLMDRIPLEVVRELSFEIKAFSEVTEQEGKA